jgi:glutathione S-transferase
MPDEQSAVSITPQLGILNLYWGPGTCAIGIHVLLEELGPRYRTVRIDVHGGGTRSPEFLAINPKGKVPTLVREDGSVLTEFGAIATWLGLAHEPAGLLPRDAERHARITELIGFVEGTIHGQGYGRIFRPDQFEPQDAVHQAVPIGRGSVRAQGVGIVEQGFAILNAQLDGRHFAVGDEFSIADAALFYVERWAPQNGIALPANLQRHLDQMLARHAVQRVRMIWGES